MKTYIKLYSLLILAICIPYYLDSKGLIDRYRPRPSATYQHLLSNRDKLIARNKRWTDKDIKTLANSIDYWCRERNLDKKIVLGIINNESGFYQFAIGKLGEVGLMQVYYDQNKTLLKTVNITQQGELFDIDNNINAGTLILANFLEGNKIVTALWLYNGRRGNKTKVPDEMFRYANNVITYAQGVKL